jgi:hypothetical protein
LEIDTQTLPLPIDCLAGGIRHRHIAPVHPEFRSPKLEPSDSNGWPFRTFSNGGLKSGSAFGIRDEPSAPASVTDAFGQQKRAAVASGP